MRTLNKDEHNYIKQIANIHETLLSQAESNYKCTKLSIALRYEMICSRLEHTNDKIYIYENEGQLIAFIWGYFSNEKSMVNIELLYVEPQFRKLGIATQLKIALEKWAKTMNAKRISSTIHKSNLPMISLNKDLGYQVSHVKMYKDID